MLPSTQYSAVPSFSSPVRDYSTSPLTSPIRTLSPASNQFTIPIINNKPSSVFGSTTSTNSDNAIPAPITNKYIFKDTIFYDNSEDYDAEGDETANEEDDATQEVMPSALDDDIMFSRKAETSQATIHIDELEHDITGNEPEASINSDIDLLPFNKGLGKDQLKSKKELHKEKVQVDNQLSAIIDQLQNQLREKEKDFEALQTQHLTELNVREERIKKLSRQNARLEREKWDLLKRAREATERSVNLRTKLEMHDSTLRSAQGELDLANEELAAVKSANNSLRALVRDLKTRRSVNDVATQVDIEFPPIINIASLDMNREEIEETDSGTASGGGGHISSEDWGERASISSSQYEIRDDNLTPTNSFTERLGKERRSMKNLLKFKFRRSASAGKRHSTSSLVHTSTSSLDNLQLSSQSSLTVPTRSHSVATQHKLSVISLHETTTPQGILQEFQNVPLAQWNTRAIIAWMEVTVGMPQYISTMRQYVTSGHALLALTNTDMEKRLGINHPLHRRRLRLAVEQLRGKSNSTQYPEADSIDHNWVAYTWAVDCGLPHLSSSLYNGMVNGHVLNSLSRDDLKKHLKITKKVEQLSFLSGVELLRMHEFNRNSIKSHHNTTNNPLYWNNQDICDWLKRINLEEYADNVKGAGVHGALLFLERGYFNSELLANIIHIHQKSSLRRHLAAQLAKLFSNDELNSFDNEEDLSECQLPAASPSHDNHFSSIDHSPHPSRRMITQASSIPNLVEEENVNTNFDRNHVGRRSLRVRQ
jgi:hypothetical protein